MSIAVCTLASGIAVATHELGAPTSQVHTPDPSQSLRSQAFPSVPKRSELSLVNIRQAMQSTTYARLSFRRQSGETSRPCSVFWFSSFLLVLMQFERYAVGARTSCSRIWLCGSKSQR